MLIGLISDVHSNSVALKAVLEELDELGVKIIMHAGDIVGYNPYPEDATPDLLTNINGDVLVLGHTHVPFIMDYGARGMVVNPGSVGQPRDRNPDASFAVLDTATREVKLKRTKYNVEKVIRDMLKAHLPERLAYRLRAGR